jgi:hypothetical protein
MKIVQTPVPPKKHEMKFKTTLRFHFTSQNGSHQENNNKWQQEHREKGSLTHSWQESKLVQALWNSVWRFLKKLKTELPYDPAKLLLGIYPKDCKSADNRDLHTYVYCRTIHNSQAMESA